MNIGYNIFSFPLQTDPTDILRGIGILHYTLQVFHLVTIERTEP